MSRYEVEIRVKANAGSSDTMHTLRETFEFGDNPLWFLAGEAYAVELAAKDMIEKLLNEARGAGGQPLDDVSGKPRRV